MTPVPLKLELGKLIKSGLRASGLRQLDLAQHLQISASAISQMLNGKTAPATVHLDEIFQLLNYNSNQTFIMRDLLARIRSGMYDLNSPVNEFINNARKESNLSLSKLAVLSQIPIGELRLLETCSTAVPSNEQVITLAEALRFDAENIQQLIDELPQQIANYGDVGKSSIQVPVLSLDDILKFNPVLEDIKTFVCRNCKQGFSKQSLNGPIDNDNVFVIVASGDSFEPPFPGSVRLIVAVENLPETNDTVIVKLKDSCKLLLKRFVIEDNNIYLMPFNGIADKQDSKPNNLEWVRKVLKVTVNSL